MNRSMIDNSGVPYSLEMRSQEIFGTLGRAGAIQTSATDRLGKVVLDYLFEHKKLRCLEFATGRNGGYHYKHYDLFNTRVKPNEKIYFTDVNEVFAHWFAGIVQFPLDTGKLNSLGRAMEKLGLTPGESKFILSVLHPTYYRFEDYRALRRRESKETRTGREDRATILKKLDESHILRSSEAGRKEKSALIDLKESGKIRKVIAGGDKGTGTTAAREYGYYNLFKTGFRPSERIYFRKFNLTVAKWFAQWIKQPVDSGVAKALSHAFQRMGFEEEEAKLMIAIAYPGYYTTLQQAVSLRSERTR